MIRYLLLLLVATQPVLFAMSRTPSAPYSTAETIGVRTLHFEDKDRSRPVVIEFWYPTDEAHPSLELNAESVWIHPKESRDVALSTRFKNYPLILMSHGHRGDRRERTWLVDSLVRQGFLVASIEHYGNCWHQFNPLSSFCFWDRAKDVSFAITQLLEESTLKEKIDPQRIGFVGYSMGGMTGLALAGAQVINAKQVAKDQLNQLEGIRAELLNTIDFSEAEKSYFEPRIRSMLLICPATFAYLPETLRRIKIPIGLIASIHDEVLPHKENAYKIIQYVGPYKMKLLRNKTSHYAFLNQMTEKGYELLQKAMPPRTSMKWAPIHKEATTFAVKFFQETLNTPKQLAKE